MNTLAIIETYYKRGSELYNTLIRHSNDVVSKSLEISRKHPELGIDEEFVREAGALHDIAIYTTNAPKIKCFGILPYISHGYLGRELLDTLGYPKHALVCERHTGSGISEVEIIEQHLPLPHRDMLPVSIEEKIICYADCFFSKAKLGEEKSLEEVRVNLGKFGKASLDRFDELHALFS